MLNRCAIAPILAAVFALAVTASASAAPVLTSQSGWAWGNPRPQGNELRAIDFAGGRGYAVGEFGTIVRTDDGGSTYTGVRTGVVDDLNKLRVLDADTFVAGGGCTLMRSDDSGQTLRRLRFNPSATCGSPLAAMHFANDQVGYLFRADGSVLRTEDGGSRYSSRTALPANAGGPPNDAWFTAADTGVVLTGSDTLGRIYRTTDSGNTWTDVETAGAMRGVHFVSATVGYAVGQSGVFKTNDGGASWGPTTASPPHPLRSIRCGDAQHCVTIGVNNQVDYTDDGFETTRPSGHQPPPGGAAPLLPIQAVSASFASATRVATVGLRGQTRTSDNAGQGFTNVDSVLQGSYSRLRLTSQSTAFAPGNAGGVAVTTDSGATWARVGAPTTADIVDVAFPTSSLGYAADSDGALFRTENGGTSWAILGDAGVRPRSITSSADGNTVMLIGPRGVLRSANAGGNFDPVEAKGVANVELDDVDRTSDGGVYVHGRRALVFTSNEGQRWSVLKRPSRSPIQEIDFVDKKVGYALTDDGRVWKTSNRGRKWSELLTVGHADGYELAFGDRSDGYLAIDSFAGETAGWILHTSDGGASWRPQLISRDPVASTFGSLVAAQGGIAHALVSTSDLFRTDTGGDLGERSTITVTTKTRRLRRKGKVRIDGKLSPAAPGARVEVDVRELGSNRWRRILTTVRSDGTFVVNTSVKRSSSFVAQWAGDQSRNSDGSPALRVTVGR